MLKYGLKNMIGAQKTRVGSSGGETQPDSCYYWDDPPVVVVSVTVNGRIHALMDHRLIRLKNILRGAGPRIREFYEYDRIIRNKDINDSSVKKKLNEEILLWYEKYAPYIFSSWKRSWR